MSIKEDINYNLKNVVKKVYLLLLVTLFPLVFWDFYYNIADVKFIVFVTLTLLAVTILMVYNVWMRSIDINIKNGTVICMGIWSIVCVVSTMLSKNKEVALMGNDGRSFGTITILCLLAMLVMLSDLVINYKFFIRIFLITSCVVSGLAIVNFLGIDFIGFYDGVDYGLRELFQTTLGHVDICSNFYAVTVSVSYILYLYEDDRKEKIFNFIFFCINFMGSFAGGCDSGYIICGVLVVLTLIYVNNYIQLAEASFAGVIAIILSKILMFINSGFEHAKRMDSIAILITSNSVSSVILVLLSVSIIIFQLRKNKGSEKQFKIVKYMLLALVVLGIAGVLSLFVYYSFVNTNKDIGTISNILRFDDEWGSRRGYIWKRGMEFYKDNTWLEKLFGVGPDTLQQSMEKKYGDEMLARFSAYYDNMHNEYMQYLVTTGILGLLSYVGVIYYSLKNGVRNMKNNIYIRALVAGIICYLVQACVNVNQVITTPYLFICIALVCTNDVANEK